MTARRLSVDERIELRAALVARGARIADIRNPDAHLVSSKAAIDGLIRVLDDVRIEVTR